jgi:lactate dehydrogenase-like 2-hydroxyacid dehydrogenase
LRSCYRLAGSVCSRPQAGARADGDIVVNALPLKPATEGLLVATAFAAMPRDSYLVNIARGQHAANRRAAIAQRGGPPPR